MSDDGFHEIQLNGKQLIFLFMAAALVLVVAFLSGVLVGRGVRVQKDAAVAAAETTAASGPAEPVPAAATPADAGQPAPPPVTAIAPPTPADEELSYSSRLVDAEPPAETLKPTEPAAEKASKPGSKIGVAPQPAAQPRSASPPPQPAGSAVATSKVNASLAVEPPGDGYYLKIAALRDRGQSEAIAKRLTAKGYSTYIVPLSGRGPVLYSVRVGKYKSRREADVARRRLEKEEQFKPLISH